MKKRMISWLLAVCIVLTLLPAEAVAAETVSQPDEPYEGVPDLEVRLYAEGDAITCTLENGGSITVDRSGTVISGTLGSSGVVEIPSEIPVIDEETGEASESIAVTTIGYRAFYEKNLTSVILPEGVTTLESWAFAHNGGLTSINFPASLTTVKNNAFKYTGFTSVTIPSTIKNMEYDVFHGCNSLKTVVIEDGVTQIADSTFYGCPALTDVTIPDSVTRIGTLAFRGCSSLQSLNIPDSVSSIGSWAFTYSGI